MKQRPTRLELLHKFFPELKEASGSKTTDAAIQINIRACEAILADMIDMFDKGYNADGPGVLCIRLHKDSKESEYLPQNELALDLNYAEKVNDTDVIDALSKIIDTIEDFNAEKGVLLMLVDNSRMQVLPIDREYPARAIQAMMEEYAC
jgi:hypothetical protein